MVRQMNRMKEKNLGKISFGRKVLEPCVCAILLGGELLACGLELGVHHFGPQLKGAI